MPEPTTPPLLPDALLGETPTAKLLWLYLRPKGPVGYSTYKLAVAVYLSQPLISIGLGRLRARGLLTDLGEHRKRVRGTYQAVKPGGRAGPLFADMDAKSPPLLPAVLKEATPTTRVAYLYLEPHGEVRVTVVQLEERLGISHRPAFKALRDLRKLGLVALSANARGRLVLPGGVAGARVGWRRGRTRTDRE